jgi:hypothetical protein
VKSFRQLLQSSRYPTAQIQMASLISRSKFFLLAQIHFKSTHFRKNKLSKKIVNFRNENWPNENWFDIEHKINPFDKNNPEEFERECPNRYSIEQISKMVGVIRTDLTNIQVSLVLSALLYTQSLDCCKSGAVRSTPILPLT